MNRKKYNWKAREVVKAVIDDSKTKKIQIELDKKSNYDDCNALVLPSEKRKTKIKREQQQITRILSKKQRKHLEKIVEKKKKKENRASLLDALSKVQASAEELGQLTSIAEVQTKGIRKYFQEQNSGEKVEKRKREDVETESEVRNSISGSKRKRIIKCADFGTSDPNVVGLDESDSDAEIIEPEMETIEPEVETIEPEVETIEPEVEIIEPEVKTIVDTPTDKQKSAENKQRKGGAKRVHKPAIFVPLNRTETMQASRLKLPILAEEQQIMETINENSVVLIAGETGSGKTTQVPQFLYEAGYAENKMIGVTEPRRVAAISMSKRVGEEMNLTEREVSYLIRFEGNVSEETKLKFMTDGVLLKEVQSDLLLTKYSVIILDEAHERSVYTDILIGLLSRIVPLRNKKNMPLKLIIMSATLRVADFTENSRLFKVPPPVVKVEARQFPVTVHFNKRTHDDYVKEAFSKACKIHTTLPDGAILIFVTGQQEVNRLVRKLRRAFPFRYKDQKLFKDEDDSEIEEKGGNDSEIEENMQKLLRKKKKVPKLPKINLDDFAMPGVDIDESEGIDENDEIDEDDDLDNDNQTVFANCQPLWTLPLYSLLPTQKQARVFQPTPPNTRLCVVSTNVAETSLTIPGVKYVIDSGKAKQKLYDKVTGVSSYQISWTSQASADQRAGRAGRIAAGHCYRLYSSAVFNDVFRKFSIPEIMQKPVDDLYLQMKCMGIDRIVNFPFPSAPDNQQLKMAERRLEILGAIQTGSISPLGNAIAKFPVLPRFGKMLALSHQHNLLAYTICMVAALSVQEVLQHSPHENAEGTATSQNEETAKSLRKKWQFLRRQWANTCILLGDPLVLIKAVGAAEHANVQGHLEKFCRENGLRVKAVGEIRKLRIQLTNEINLNIPDCNVIVDPNLKPITDVQARLLRQILLAGFGDQVAKKISQDDLKQPEDKLKYKYAYSAMDMEDPVFIHTNSVLKKTLPEFVVYQEIFETNKLYMRGVTAIEPEWLPTFVPHLCNLSEPLLDPVPRFENANGKIYCTVSGSFGRQAWPLPPTEIEFPKSVDLYKWFARFLLEGKVFKKLEKYTKSLLSAPNTMVKSWAKLQPRTDAILKALMSKEVCTKEILQNIWEIQPEFLLHEYQKWMPESAHNEVSLIWPPL